MTNNSESKIAIGYVRVSTDEQADHGHSIEMQKKRILEWAGRNNFNVLEMFEDNGKSATNTNRQGLKNLYRYISKNKVDAMICWKLDRLSRSLTDFYGEVLGKFNKYNIKIAVVENNMFDAYSTEQVVMTALTIAIGEKEVIDTRSRTKAIMKSRKEDGYFMGKAPFGYVNDKDNNKRGIIIPHPEKRKIVKRMYELYATGLYSLERLGHALKDEGFVDNNGQKFSKKLCENILKNPIYIGHIKHHSLVYKNGKHEHLISEDLFYRVSCMFKTDRKPRTKNEAIAYAKLITCTQCGYAVIGELVKEKHIYYHCTNYSKKHPNQTRITQADLDTAFQDVLDCLHITNKHLKPIKNAIFKKVLDLQLNEKETLNRLKKQRDKIKKILTNAQTRLLADDTEIKYLKDIIAENEKTLSGLIIQINNLEVDKKDLKDRMEILVDIANNLPRIFSSATPKEKRVIVSIMTKKITYYRGVLNVTLHPLFEELRMSKLEYFSQQKNPQIENRTAGSAVDSEDEAELQKVNENISKTQCKKTHSLVMQNA
ncbi:MAG: recombinase family protein [Candidatus Gastranaerophilales bacterium]